MPSWFNTSFKVLLFASIAMLCACSDDGNPEDGYLVIDESTIEIGNEGGSVTRYVSSNTQWYTRSDYYWIHVSPSQGTGNTNISISVDANPNNTRREGYVYVYTQNGTTETHQLKVEQRSGSGTSSLGTPQNLKATVNGKSVNLTWNAVSGATKYHVYRMDTGSGYYNLISTVNTNSATDSNPLEQNYYKVKAANNSGESEFSNSIYAYVSGGGNTGDGNTQKRPSAPTGLRVSNEGNNYYPSVVIRWNEVSGANKYYVYKASSANGSYSQLGTAQYNVFTDPTPPTNGKSAYYKVKAVNDAGTSDYSDYAVYTSVSNDEAFSPGYRYGNCSATSSTITLRWENLTGQGYGKATKIVLRVWNPYAEEWQDTELNATATSASFNFTNKIDNDGYVRCGIVVSNSKGSFTAGSKVYNSKTRTWLN